MKKRFLCLSLIFALTAAQVMPVAAARKDEVQAEKANTQTVRNREQGSGA